MSTSEKSSFAMDGAEIVFTEGQSVGEALLAAGQPLLRRTVSHEGRGIFCGMGICGECRVIVNGTPNVCACQEMASAGLEVQTQLDAELGGRV